MAGWDISIPHAARMSYQRAILVGAICVVASAIKDDSNDFLVDRDKYGQVISPYEALHGSQHGEDYHSFGSYDGDYQNLGYSGHDFGHGFGGEIYSQGYGGEIQGHGFGGQDYSHGYGGEVQSHGFGGEVHSFGGQAYSHGSDGGHHYEHKPKYHYEYSVHDPHTHDYKTHQESRDGDKVKGYYNLKEADGSLREVHYTADHKNGFQAIVTKNGKVVHPHVESHHTSDHHY